MKVTTSETRAEVELGDCNVCIVSPLEHEECGASDEDSEEDANAQD